MMIHHPRNNASKRCILFTSFLTRCFLKDLQNGLISPRHPKNPVDHLNNTIKNKHAGSPAPCFISGKPPQNKRRTMIRYLTVMLYLLYICLSAPAAADDHGIDINSVISKADPKTALFMLNVYTSREQIIENRMKFSIARSMLPATYEDHTLESMDIKDRVLYLVFSTSSSKIPLIWKNNPQKLRKIYRNAVCRVFSSGRITRIDEIRSTLYYRNQKTLYLTDGRANCRRD